MATPYTHRFIVLRGIMHILADKVSFQIGNSVQVLTLDALSSYGKQNHQRQTEIATF